MPEDSEYEKKRELHEFEVTPSHGQGIPCLWERGGGYTNTGWSVIIAGPSGEPKKPLYIRKRGQLANSYHALIPVQVGDHVITCNHHREDFFCEVWKLVRVDQEKAVGENVARFYQGEWSPELPMFLEDAVKAAKEKALCYHCRSPHFIKEQQTSVQG